VLANTVSEARVVWSWLLAKQLGQREALARAEGRRRVRASGPGSHVRWCWLLQGKSRSEWIHTVLD